MKIRNKQNDKIAETFANPEKITQALALGVRDALKKHKQAGNSIVVWREGKIVWIAPEEIVVQK